MAEAAQGQEPSSQAQGSKTPVYEVGFHIVPTIGEEQIGGVVEKIRAALGESEIIKDQFPSKIVLTYTIERSNQGKREKYHEAYFGWIKFAAERENIPAIEQAIRGMREVLRYILVETVREDVASPRRAIFTSDRLEGQTLKKPTSTPETAAPAGVSEEELDKSIEALVQ
ncbi:30S ribosomal protein S6 [Candidatus Parcubacteria bacterium]|nr:30S ribosomal protein S6 [Candidatus Parcubacteria bacterium]